MIAISKTNDFPHLRKFAWTLPNKDYTWQDCNSSWLS